MRLCKIQSLNFKLNKKKKAGKAAAYKQNLCAPTAAYHRVPCIISKELIDDDPRIIFNQRPIPVHNVKMDFPFLLQSFIIEQICHVKISIISQNINIRTRDTLTSIHIGT